ncbi:MAG: sporulation integral membrane protein YtvI [Clostridia bacterium]|nr:sporulation integral membrane protein YtvI [Clostridia bacterium]
MSQILSSWNEQLNGLPRKLALVAATFGLAALFLWVLPYGWPFAAAWLLSRILEPFVQLMSKGFFHLSARKKRVFATLAGMVLLFGLFGAAFTALVSWLWQELSGFVRSLPQLLEWGNDRALPQLTALYRRVSVLIPEQMRHLLEEGLAWLSQSALKLAGSLSAWLTSGAWATAASIPHAMLSIVLTITGTYYFTADRERIARFWQRTFPVGILKRSRLIRANVLRALVGQLRSQLTISLVVMFFLMVCLGISGVRYGVVIGMLIGIADALPLLGAGVFLIPWSLVSFLNGQTALGITLACLYAGAIVIRQILEPKLIGRQLGLYPLAAMTAMYAGYRLLGFIGLLLGPVLLSLAKAVLDADSAATQAPT